MQEILDGMTATELTWWAAYFELEIEEQQEQERRMDLDRRAHEGIERMRQKK